MVFSPFNVAVSNRSFCLSAFGWFLKTTTTLPRAPGSQLPPRTPSPPRRTRHAMSHPVTADDPEAIRITPGFLRHELTKWDRGEPTAPKQRPSYFWAPQETSLKPPRRAGANHPTFQLTLTREDIDDDFAEINRALRGDPAPSASKPRKRRTNGGGAGGGGGGEGKDAGAGATWWRRHRTPELRVVLYTGSHTTPFAWWTPILRTFPGVSLRPPPAFNPRPRRLSTSTDAFELHPAIRLYRTTLNPPPPPPTAAAAAASPAVARARRRRRRRRRTRTRTRRRTSR